jgi:hypothetical protein
MVTSRCHFSTAERHTETDRVRLCLSMANTTYLLLIDEDNSTLAHSIPGEWTLRSQVNQTKPVEVNCLSIANSHSAWRFYLQSSKHLVELATCAHDPDVQELLVQLSNEYHEECKRVAMSPLGQELSLFLRQHPDLGQEDEGVLGMAGTANDLAATDVEELVTEADAAPESSKRVRKQPDRYNGFQYDNDGAYNGGCHKLKRISHWHTCFSPGLVLLILAQ